jgi:hypothetical protein
MFRCLWIAQIHRTRILPFIWANITLVESVFGAFISSSDAWPRMAHPGYRDIADLGLASPSAETYARVLKLDKKIRQWRLPDELNSKTPQPTEEQKTVATLRSTTGMIFREVTLMCLHRFVSLVYLQTYPQIHLLHQMLLCLRTFITSFRSTHVTLFAFYTLCIRKLMYHSLPRPCIICCRTSDDYEVLVLLDPCIQRSRYSWCNCHQGSRLYACRHLFQRIW